MNIHTGPFQKLLRWNRLQAALRQAFQAIVRFATLVQSTDGRGVPDPKRVLLMNPAHLGDIVISTSLLGVLKSAYPAAEIGFVTASWSQCVVRNHPLVRFTHTIDHWRMSREDIALPEKILRYFQTRGRALKEIRKLNYDIAIHLHPGLTDLLDVSWKARIPVRAAFSKSLWAPLATLLAEYPAGNLFQHQGGCQAELLRKIGIADRHFARRFSTLAPTSDKGLQELSELLAGENVKRPPYAIVHLGAGAAYKELPPAFWREVATALARERLVLFTGRGARESANIEQAIRGLSNCLNACDKLSWEGFVAAIRQAHVVYGVDSAAGHVAAAVGVKSVNVYHGSAGVARWRPEGSNATVWSNPVSCSPCHLKHGCADMACLKGIEPLHILQNSRKMSAVL